MARSEGRVTHYVFIGGRYDGVQLHDPWWPEPPDEVWLFRGERDGETKLYAARQPKVGGERYILAARREDRIDYLHESIHSSRALRRKAAV